MTHSPASEPCARSARSTSSMRLGRPKAFPAAGPALEEPPAKDPRARFSRCPAESTSRRPPCLPALPLPSPTSAAARWVRAEPHAAPRPPARADEREKCVLFEHAWRRDIRGASHAPHLHARRATSEDTGTSPAANRAPQRTPPQLQSNRYTDSSRPRLPPSPPEPPAADTSPAAIREHDRRRVDLGAAQRTS